MQKYSPAHRQIKYHFDGVSGKYIVEMYESGMKIGTTSFDLK